MDFNFFSCFMRDCEGSRKQAEGKVEKERSKQRKEPLRQIHSLPNVCTSFLIRETWDISSQHSQPVDTLILHSL